MFTIALACIAFAYILYIFYLAYCTLRVAKDNGKLAKAPKIVKGIAYSILFIAVILDGLFNVTFGSIVFLEPPEIKRLMFTARCAKWREDKGWRGKIARWVCDGWLNPFEEGHC